MSRPSSSSCRGPTERSLSPGFKAQTPSTRATLFPSCPRESSVSFLETKREAYTGRVRGEYNRKESHKSGPRGSSQTCPAPRGDSCGQQEGDPAPHRLNAGGFLAEAERTLTTRGEGMLNVGSDWARGWGWGWVGGWKRSRRREEQSRGRPLPNAFLAFNRKGGGRGVPGREGRGRRGERATRPEIGVCIYHHASPVVWRLLTAPGHVSPGKAGRKEGAGRSLEGDGPGGGGVGCGRPAPPRYRGRESHGARTTPRLARLQRLGRRRQLGPVLERGAGMRGPGRGRSCRAARAPPERWPRAPARLPCGHRPPACSASRLLSRAPRGLGRPRLPAAGLLQKQKGRPGPLPP